MNIRKLENTRDSLKSIGQRFIAPSPSFFKKIMKICGGVIATSGAVLLIPVTFPTIILPAIWTTICTHAVISATIALGVAKTGVDWNKVDEKKAEEKE